MNKDKEVEYYKKFPPVLKTKLVNKEISLPDGTQFEYEPILAYRGLTRNTNDNTPVNINDMISRYDMKKKPRGMVVDEKDPRSYAISLFKTIDMLKLCWNFPRPNKKVAQGYVYMNGGPQYTDDREHVSWWLYENIDFNGFVIKDDINE